MKLAQVVPVVLLSLLVVGVPQVLGAESINQLLKKGWEARKEDRYLEAEHVFRKAIELNSKNLSALTGLASVLHDQGQLDEAIVLYRQAVQAAPGNSTLQGYLDKAVAQRSQIQTVRSHHIRTLRSQIKTMSANRDALVAQLNTVRALIQSAPNKPWSYKAYVDLGNALIWQNQIEESIAISARELVRLDPTFNYASVISDSSNEDQRRVEAIALYQTAIRLNPTVADAYFGLGNVLYQQNKVDDAIANYRKASQLNPRDVFAQKQLEKAQRRLGSGVK
ncbi:tetratricopeptide repeat protein [Myxacorys almedinensis]|uniref:Tetratricopeptide repeat protein n=1 Tax=Myxacorys almedinensis A TaxID=2690445 RepID=A0A8J7Z526_9CYAN|nr:tetratricopeptide repeat protein [Myxacorys almedinensis]NDJ18248.1 tetratricopeptide repeat protein [Myxacorys almedinensis A]